MLSMCKKCVKQAYCKWRHHFNSAGGCIEFQDRDYTTSVSGTLNVEAKTVNKELTPLEVSNQLKEFISGFVENSLDRMFVRGSFDIIETALKALEIIKKDENLRLAVMLNCNYGKDYDSLREVLLCTMKD